MLLEVILLVPAIWIAIFFWWTRKYDHWAKMGIAYEKGFFPFGSIRDIFKQQFTLGDWTMKLCRKFPNERLIGFYAFQNPMLIINDPELVRDVLVKDFNSYSIAAFEFHESVDPMMALNPFGLSGEKWKLFRGFLTSSQSLSKLKGLINNVSKSSKNFVGFISKRAGQEINIREFIRYYTVDAVVSSAFSSQSNSFEDPKNPFVHETTDTMFTNNRAILSAFFGSWVTFLTRDRLVSKNSENFFVAFARRMAKDRKGLSSPPNDFLQQIVTHNEKCLKEGKTPMSETEIAATLMAFFLDATDSVSLVFGNALFQIALDQQVQEKLRDEIKKNGNSIEDFDYEKVNSMEYLEMVLSENLRVNPTISVIHRLCTKETQLGGYKIDKGIKLIVPLTAFYNDPKYYPEPEKFNPERFSKDNIERIPKMAFLPFGEGPKICAGKSFALLELKIGLISILMNFKVTLSPKHTEKNIQFDKSNLFVNWPKEDTFLKFEPLKNK